MKAFSCTTAHMHQWILYSLMILCYGKNSKILYYTQKASRHLTMFALERANRIIVRAEKNTNPHLLSGRHWVHQCLKNIKIADIQISKV